MQGLTADAAEQEFTIYDKKDIAAGLQNFLICLEMFPAAVAHAYAFPPRDYLDPAHQGSRGLVQSLRAMFDVRDVVEDMNLVVDDTVRCLLLPCCPAPGLLSSSATLHMQLHAQMCHWPCLRGAGPGLFGCCSLQSAGFWAPAASCDSSGADDRPCCPVPAYDGRACRGRAHGLDHCPAHARAGDEDARQADGAVWEGPGALPGTLQPCAARRVGQPCLP